MNNILLEIFPEAVNNLIVRFNIHPIAEAFKRKIRIDEEVIQDIMEFNKCSFSCAYFSGLLRQKTNSL